MSGSNLALTPLSDTAETKAAQNFQMAGEINFQMCSKTRARTKPFRQGIQCVGAGWRRSDDRTCLQPNSLQAGNFSGNFERFSTEETPALQETPEPQGLLSTFPTENSRENLFENRDFSGSNRENRMESRPWGDQGLTRGHRQTPMLCPFACGAAWSLAARPN